MDEFNKIKGLKDVFAIGDVAYMETEDYQTGHPQVAQVAIQRGKRLGKNLINKICRNKPLVPFHYKHKGSMATVWKNRALVE